MVYQTSIRDVVRTEGKNVYTNRRNYVRFHPAQEDSGLVFRVKRQEIPALLDYARHRKLGISLDNGAERANLVEHLLSPIYALGIDNLVIELSDGTCPTTDNSAKEIFDALKEATVPQNSKKRFFAYNRDGNTSVKNEQGFPDVITVRPAQGFFIDYLAYYPHKVVRRQRYRLDVNEINYQKEVMEARSPALFPDWVFKLFGNWSFFDIFLLSGRLGLRGIPFLTHGITGKNYLLIGSKEAERYANPAEFGVRYDGNEFVRHKILDVIGTLALFGRQFKNTEFIFKMTGHRFDLYALRMLSAEFKAFSEVNI